MTVTEQLERDSAFAALAAAHPLEARIIRAALSRVESAIQNPINQAEFTRLLAESAEIFSWLSDKESVATGADIEHSLLENIKAGWPTSMALEYERVQRIRPRRGPRSHRRRILHALETKQMNPKLSWMRLAARFCPCPNPTHSARCRDLVRKRTVALKEMLDRLGVE